MFYEQGRARTARIHELDRLQAELKALEKIVKEVEQFQKQVRVLEKQIEVIGSLKIGQRLPAPLLERD